MAHVGNRPAKSEKQYYEVTISVAYPEKNMRRTTMGVEKMKQDIETGCYSRRVFARIAQYFKLPGNVLSIDIIKKQLTEHEEMEQMMYRFKALKVNPKKMSGKKLYHSSIMAFRSRLCGLAKRHMVSLAFKVFEIDPK